MVGFFDEVVVCVVNLAVISHYSGFRILDLFLARLTVSDLPAFCPYLSATGRCQKASASGLECLLAPSN